MAIRVLQIPALQDNYNYVLVNDTLKEAIAVDPSEGEPILRCIDHEKLRLKQIWITHHHPDHVGGNLYLQSNTKAEILGPRHEQIPGRDKIVQGGDEFKVWNQRVMVFATPGHTLAHIAYYLPEKAKLFSGDVIFSLGCGRLFEGSYSQKFSTLQELCKLPGETMIYSAHEYSKKNAEFALQFEPGNLALQKRYENILALRAKNQPTVPTTLAEELKFNPFLRAHSPEIRRHLELEESSDLEVFSELRRLRNNY